MAEDYQHRGRGCGQGSEEKIEEETRHAPEEEDGNQSPYVIRIPGGGWPTDVAGHEEKVPGEDEDLIKRELQSEGSPEEGSGLCEGRTCTEVIEDWCERYRQRLTKEEIEELEFRIGNPEKG